MWRRRHTSRGRRLGLALKHSSGPSNWWLLLLRRASLFLAPPHFGGFIEFPAAPKLFCFDGVEFLGVPCLEGEELLPLFLELLLEVGLLAIEEFDLPLLVNDLLLVHGVLLLEGGPLPLQRPVELHLLQLQQLLLLHLGCQLHLVLLLNPLQLRV